MKPRIYGFIGGAKEEQVGQEDCCIIPFLQPLLYNYVGTSTRDEDRDKDHKLDHDL